MVREHLGPLAPEDLRHLGRADVGIEELGGRRNIAALPGGEVVDHDHLVAGRHVGIRDLRGDEPRATRDRDLHPVPLAAEWRIGPPAAALDLDPAGCNGVWAASDGFGCSDSGSRDTQIGRVSPWGDHGHSASPCFIRSRAAAAANRGEDQMTRLGTRARTALLSRNGPSSVRPPPRLHGALRWTQAATPAADNFKLYWAAPRAVSYSSSLNVGVPAVDSTGAYFRTSGCPDAGRSTDGPRPRATASRA